MSQNTTGFSTAGGPEPPDGRSPSAPSPTPHPDPRLIAFTNYLAALDRCDVSGRLSSTRTLWKLGFDVSAPGTPNEGGGRLITKTQGATRDKTWMDDCPIIWFGEMIYYQNCGDFDRAADSRNRLKGIGYTITYRKPGTASPRKRATSRKAAGQ